MLHAKTTYLKIRGSDRNQMWSKKIHDSDMIHESVMDEVYLTLTIAIERGEPTLPFSSSAESFFNSHRLCYTQLLRRLSVS